MNLRQEQSNGQSKSLLGWLGFANSPARDSKSHNAAARSTDTRPVMSIGQRRRVQMMESIASLLLEHDLDITQENLIAAHSICSGMDPMLTRRVTAKTQAGETITQNWLDEVTNVEAKSDKLDELDKIAAQLGSHIDKFSKNTRDAHVASINYGNDLEGHLAQLNQVSEAGQFVINIASLATQMLERTRKVEAEMQKSVQETQALRNNLERAKCDADMDHLTGIPNRRSFEVLLDKQCREAKAAIEPLSIAFCDIDHFKLVNTNHGHETGDRVIKAVADVLFNITNEACHVARHGGEEFVMLFRGKTPNEAKAILDGARERLGNRNFINRKTDQPIGMVTFSGGVADVFDYEDTRDALAAADEALYQAKSAGRNKIQIAERKSV